MIHLRIYDMNYHIFYKDFKSYGFPSDSRYDNIFRYLKKYKDTKREVCLVICDSYILSCMDLMVEQKITSKFDKIIFYMPECFWDEFNDSKTLQNKIDKIDDSEKITIIFNFFCDSPFDLKNINYITTIGCFGSITKLYLNKYKFKSLKENYKKIKYNVISKFGRPSEEKLLVYHKIKDFKNLIYSINSTGLEEYYTKPKIFPSELNETDVIVNFQLPKEDFQSASEVVVETRWSTFGNGKRLVTNTEKTLKGFMFKRPVFLFAQPESYSYLRQYGFKFPKLFGYDGTKVKQVGGGYETEYFDMVDEVCSRNTKDILDFFIENEDIWEHNYENLHSFIQLHDNRVDNIFKEICDV